MTKFERIHNMRLEHFVSDAPIKEPKLFIKKLSKIREKISIEHVSEPFHMKFVDPFNFKKREIADANNR